MMGSKTRSEELLTTPVSLFPEPHEEIEQAVNLDAIVQIEASERVRFISSTEQITPQCIGEDTFGNFDGNTTVAHRNDNNSSLSLLPPSKNVSEDDRLQKASSEGVLNVKNCVDIRCKEKAISCE